MRAVIMKSHMVVVGVCFAISSVSAKDEVLDAHAFLPLFERNTIARKVLDMSYSVNSKGKHLSNSFSFQSDVHLVFDAETGKYRRERKYYPDPADTNSYTFSVQIWNENEYIEWDRVVNSRLGFRALGAGIYEESGRAMIRARPLGDIVIPLDIMFLFGIFPRTFAQTVPEQNPKLRNMTGDVITIETQHNKFVFSRKNSALEKIEFYDKGEVELVFNLFNHIECSGVWIPLRIVMIIGKRDSEDITEIFVDPKTLRLLDKVEDDSIFNETLPSGCYVNDDIKKTAYTLTMLDNPPQDVEALQKMLEKMLEQAEEQKATVEKTEQEKKGRSSNVREFGQ